jgi:NAD(P)-dependent dehydrogenase (short-subunit alcohol dehydrogenase family)
MRTRGFPVMIDVSGTRIDSGFRAPSTENMPARGWQMSSAKLWPMSGPRNRKLGKRTHGVSSGTPEDVASAALYLASDEAAWIAGIILDVAGGAVMV